ncbi:MAG: ECF transporter S component [bacterium]
MKPGLSKIAAVGIFSGLAFAGGYIFVAVPNVEIITALIFLSGISLGTRNGILVGVIAQSLFSTLNPFGISPPPLFVAQVANRALVGYVGGRFGKFNYEERKFWIIAVYLGITGLLLTWLFDIMTDFSSFFISGFSFEQMKLTFLLGLAWYLVHGIGNTLIFALVLPVVIQGLRSVNFIKQANIN